MIRNGTQKLGGKPPPPVPPRPSKTLVAEALAKTRQNNYFKSPTRQAPPPPVPGTNEMVKSKSSLAVNVTLNKPPVFVRSISEELRGTPRPVVYQSSNVKCNKLQIIKKNDGQERSNKPEVLLEEEEEVPRKRYGFSEDKLKRRDSFAEEKAQEHNSFTEEQSKRNDSFLGEQPKTCDSLSVDKTKERDTLSTARDGFIEKIVKIEDAYLQEDQKFHSSKSNSSTLEKSCDSSTTSSSSSTSLEKKNWDQMLNDRNHVNTLIDEMFASVLDLPDDTSSEYSNSCSKIVISEGSEGVEISSDVDNRVVISNMQTEIVPTTVIVIKNGTAEVEGGKGADSPECGESVERGKQVKFNDQLNHELLIDELQCMKSDQEKILRRQRKPSLNLYGEEEGNKNEMARRSKCMGVDGHGEEIKNEEDANENERLTYPTIMSSLQHGLPPLPKSLSGFNLSNPNHPPTPPRSTSIRSGAVAPSHLAYPQHNGGKPMNDVGNGGGNKRGTTGLDAKLAILRQEMFSLRQLDLSLLSQLWSLNESIQDFRQMLQEQEDRVLSPPSPSPTPSSGDEEFYMSATSLNFRPVAPSTTRKQSTSSNASSMGG